MMFDFNSSYLFDEIAQNEMKAFIDEKTLFAFDLDGTLAPIVSDPGSIGISEEIQEAFRILNERTVVAVITGRSRADALSRFRVAPRYLIGNHGAEGLPGWESREIEFTGIARSWQYQLDVLLPDSESYGVIIENKGTTLSIHYRYSDDSGIARSSIIRAVTRLVPVPRIISGKYIENLLPRDAPDKGAALCLLMSQSGCAKGFFIGDDETDEEVFRLRSKNIFTVRVEKKVGSNACYHLANQQEMLPLLRKINEILL